MKIGHSEASQFGQTVDLPIFLHESLQECAQVPFTYAAGASHQQRHRFQLDKTHQSSLLNKTTSPALSLSQSGSDASQQIGPDLQRQLWFLGAGLGTRGWRSPHDFALQPGTSGVCLQCCTEKNQANLGLLQHCLCRCAGRIAENQETRN